MAERAPSYIVVGIRSVDRHSDFGERADAFGCFLSDELIPFIDSLYRTAPSRVLFGQSAGSVYGFSVFLNDPSLAAEDNGLLEDVRVFNNLAYNNRSFGIGVESWGIGSHHFLRRIAIYNNTLHGNGATGSFWGGAIHVDAFEGEDVRIQNNVFYWNFKDAVEVEPGRAPVGLVVSRNIEGVDPLFRDLARSDFHLREGSPAVDAADPALVPELGLDGLPRPQRLGFDAGAFELP